MAFVLTDKFAENEAIFPNFKEDGAETFPMTPARPDAAHTKRKSEKILVTVFFQAVPPPRRHEPRGPESYSYLPGLNSETPFNDEFASLWKTN
jgi:hypothetical protein